VRERDTAAGVPRRWPARTAAGGGHGKDETMLLLRSWALLRRYLRPLRARVLGLALLLLGGIALQLALPLLLRDVIDTALAGGPPQRLTATAGVYLGVALAAALLAVAATALGEDVGWAATNALRADLVAHCLRLDLGFHHARPPGELLERVDGDVQALAALFSRLVLRVVGNLLLLAGVLGALWLVDRRVGAALTLLAALALLALLGLRSAGVAAWQGAREAAAALAGFVEERVAGVVDLRASGATGYVLQRLARAQQGLFAAEQRAWRRTALPGGALGVLSALATALALGVGGALALRGGLTVGTVALVAAYTAALFAPLWRINDEVEGLQEAGACVRRVDELARTRSALPEGAEGLPAGALDVACEGVAFGYDPAVPVLRDLSFRLAAGRTLALLGRTGAGKTTLARLLLRLHDPQAGTVRLGGRDLRSVREAALRRRVGVVPQEVRLFAASVRDNVTLFDADVPDARVLAALDELGLGPWRRALPAGLDTVLPPGGGGLSAGEAQLLACARVFLRDPGLVLLDEAASRLDPATERRVARAFGRLLAGRTGIVVAHRLATARRADELLLLEGGRVLERGTPARLAADPGSAFARLLRAGLEEAEAPAAPAAPAGPGAGRP
jgi:ABC-type multidrug transport system fused ATPase/permease subunit